jgi:hypothetical protein
MTVSFTEENRPKHARFQMRWHLVQVLAEG